MRPLIIKELRENLRWLPVGILAIGLMTMYTVPKSAQGVSQTASNLSFIIVLVSSAFAILLGTLQSSLDLRSASLAYLSHRAVRPQQIFYSKLVAGAIIYMTAISLVLGGVAIYFALRGIDRLPVRPIETLPAFLLASLAFTFHPAAMLMIARPGSWFGTKLIPLLAPIIFIFVIAMSVATGANAFLAVLVVGLLLAISIARTSEWEWCRLTGDNKAGTGAANSLFNAITMSSGAIAAYILALVICLFAITLFDEPRSPDFYTEKGYAFDKDGNVWAARLAHHTNYIVALRKQGIELDDEPTDVRSKSTIVVEAQKLEPGLRPKLAEVNLQSVSNGSFEDLNPLQDLVRNIPSNERLLKSDWFPRIQSIYGRSYFDSRGYFLRYNEFSRLTTVISRDGFHEPGTVVGAPFANLTAFSHQVLFEEPFQQGMDYSPILMVDANGIYLCNNTTRQVSKLLEIKNDACAVLASVDAQPPKLLIESGGRYLLYEILDPKLSGEWYWKVQKKRATIPELSVKKVAEFPALRSNHGIKIAATTDNKLVAVVESSPPRFAVLDTSANADWQLTEFKRPFPSTHWEQSTRLNNEVFAGAMPMVIFGAPLIASMMCNIASPDSIPFGAWLRESIDHSLDTLLLFVGCTGVAIVFTILACRYRQLTWKATLGWTAMALPLGLATPITVFAFYRAQVCVRCSSCGNPRRIDNDKCESCGAEWETPAREGIEIFDSEEIDAKVPQMS